MRPVPGRINRPSYADTGVPVRTDENPVKSPEKIERMRRSGKAARRVLQQVSAAIAPGVTTEELDIIAHEACIAEGAYPSPLNYNGFPKAICTSINEVICHGIPDSRPLLDGDIVNCDITVFLEGVHGDHSETMLVGEVDAAGRKLVSVTRDCLMKGIAAVQVGGQVRDIGKAIQTHAEANGYEVVREFIGHGIGETFHMEPSIPHYYDPGAKRVFEPGMTFTIEPMITVGHWRAAPIWNDGWTATTADYKRTAQFEHTLLVRDDGVEILTLEAHETQPFLPADDSAAASS